MQPQSIIVTPAIAERFWSKVHKSNDPNACWEWMTWRDKDGYGQFAIKGQLRTPSHRMAWWLTFGEAPADILVCHRCDNPSCCRPDHLFLGTAQDNSSDMVAKGRSAKGDRSYMRQHPEAARQGESHPAAKLKNEEVRTIRLLYEAGDTSTIKLAKQYHVSTTTIWKIVRRMKHKLA